ncbi:methylated-DNA--[protein]-cysteine S-methyltransferase [Aquibacillus salsiterrae]|uniref:methylated-DNA--[protein]-cysteine S-methyltransferase n=1 Tax=Aquibacillus salsiterrae TaxID=2950439 RepID=A0A9X3WH60_9BACI|nr:methylated-DNA--[protein]-cysteine S-methyltransferase [Aquibacillus salsiterrae]MDC3417374.1 methylated-DNA--[protein]-cysteine S-methyltransferase [Aquibacillus salsiterrae]
MDKIVYWSQFEVGKWNFKLAATNDGLCYVGTPNTTIEELTGWLNSHLKTYTIERNDEKLQSYINQFINYFSRKSTTVSVPLDVRATSFQRKVWDALTQIPFGKTCSYSEIASKIGNPNAVRAVGGAIGANPVLITIPCHRIIGKNGSMTGFRAGVDLKKYLINLETRSTFGDNYMKI